MSERRERRDRSIGSGTEGLSGPPQTLIEALLLSAEAPEVGGYIAVPGTGPDQCDRHTGDRRGRGAGSPEES